MYAIGGDDGTGAIATVERAAILDGDAGVRPEVDGEPLPGGTLEPGTWYYRVSAVMADDDPYELLDQDEPTGIIELPPEWIRDDAVYYNFVRFSALRPYTPPSAVEEIFKAEFDGAWEEGGLFLLTLHPHISGHRSRLPVLERLIAHAKARGECWFATHAQVAEWVRDNA